MQPAYRSFISHITFCYVFFSLLFSFSVYALEICEVTHNETEIRKGFPVYLELGKDLTEEDYVSRLKEASSEGYRFFYAYEDGKIVGIAGFTIHTELSRGKAIHVDSIVVDESSRRHGIGAKLMNFIEEFGKANGATEAYLETGHKRVEANQFYPKLGYTTTAHSYRKVFPKSDN